MYELYITQFGIDAPSACCSFYQVQHTHQHQSPFNYKGCKGCWPVASERKPCDCTLSGCSLYFLFHKLPLVMVPLLITVRWYLQEALLVPSHTSVFLSLWKSWAGRRPRVWPVGERKTSQRFLKTKPIEMNEKKETHKTNNPFIVQLKLVNDFLNFCVHFWFDCICCICYALLFLLLLLFYHTKEM